MVSGYILEAYILVPVHFLEIWADISDKDITRSTA